MTLPQHDMKWRKSSFSDEQGACVELSPLGAIRDSKNPDAPELRARWSGLVAAVKTDSLTR